MSDLNFRFWLYACTFVTNILMAWAKRHMNKPHALNFFCAGAAGGLWLAVLGEHAP